MMVGWVPLAYVDQTGYAWHVVDGRRVQVGAPDAETRLFVRVADRWAFAYAPNPRARPWPAYPTAPGWALRAALEAGPLRGPGESDADHAARVQAHSTAHRAVAQAAQRRVRDATASAPCARGCQTCSRLAANS